MKPGVGEREEDQPPGGETHLEKMKEANPNEGTSRRDETHRADNTPPVRVNGGKQQFGTRTRTTTTRLIVGGTGTRDDDGGNNG